MLNAVPGAQSVKTRYVSLSKASNSIRKVTRSTSIVPSPPASKLAKRPSPTTYNRQSGVYSSRTGFLCRAGFEQTDISGTVDIKGTWQWSGPGFYITRNYVLALQTRKSSDLSLILETRNGGSGRAETAKVSQGWVGTARTPRSCWWRPGRRRVGLQAATAPTTPPAASPLGHWFLAKSLFKERVPQQPSHPHPPKIKRLAGRWTIEPSRYYGRWKEFKTNFQNYLTLCCRTEEEYSVSPSFQVTSGVTLADFMYVTLTLLGESLSAPCLRWRSACDIFQDPWSL